VARGQAEFQRIWGRRPLEDNWRRKNKQANERGEEELAGNYASPEDSLKKVNERKEKYFKNVPRGDSAIAASNEKLRDALFDISQLYYQKLEMPDSAVIYYGKVIKRYPQTEFAPKAWYAIYNLHLDQKNNAEADKAKQIILTEYPTSLYARLIRNENVSDVTKADDKAFTEAYQKLYQAYSSEKYNEVITASSQVAGQFGTHPDIAQVYFIRGSSYGKLEQMDSLIAIYNALIKNFPEAKVTLVAKNTLALLKKEKGLDVGTPDPAPGKDDKPNADEPPKPEDLAKLFFPRKPNEPLNVVALVPKEKIVTSELNNKVADLIKKHFASDKLTANSWPYSAPGQPEMFCVYVRTFNDYALAKSFMEKFVQDDNLGTLLASPETDLFFLNSTNFRTALSKKKFAEYGRYFQEYRSDIEKGTR
jgi:outer membrane protein assembly factor BamD (BamD/ComL family)